MRTAAVAPQFPQLLNVITGADAISPLTAEGVLVAVAAVAEAKAVDWLASGKAFDLPFNGDAGAVRVAALTAIRDLPVDVNVVPAQGRRKKLLVADMDSTIITCECIDELADMAQLKPRVAEITERAMRGDIDFPVALRERVALLRGLPLQHLQRVYAERVRLSPGARTLTATMRSNGAHTVLVSGGFNYFTARVAEAAGFEEHQGNRLLDDGKALIGQVAEPILGREAKLAALDHALVKYGLSSEDAIAVGDGANDLDMIRRAGIGVAYHAKPVVAAAASTSISHSDLRALLYLQGYRAEEIIAA